MHVTHYGYDVIVILIAKLPYTSIESFCKDLGVLWYSKKNLHLFANQFHRPCKKSLTPHLCSNVLQAVSGSLVRERK